MTSRRLFSKLIVQDFKKRLWCPIIIFILFFLTLEVQLMAQLENIIENPLNFDYGVVEYFNYYFLGAPNTFDLIAVIGVAVLIAVSGFSYLHSKTQIDMYNSLPVRKITVFMAKYVSGILIFAVPYLIHLMISLLVAKSKGAYASGSFGIAMSGFIVKLAIFLVIYATSIMAVMLTGNIVISLIAVVILNVYSFVVETVILQLFSDFFVTYTSYGSNGIWAFSPIAMIVKLYTSEKVLFSGIYYDITSYDYSYLPVVLIGIAAYSVISAVLFIKRPSESAGRAIAFKWAEPIVKTMCVIPVALLCGMFFSSIINDDTSYRWYAFGIIFGYVIVALVMEVIFRMDIKGIFKHKKQFLFNAACTALIFVIFRYDVMGYDSFVPEDLELQSVAVCLGLFDGSIYGILPDGTDYSYGSNTYTMENMEITGNPSVTELARLVSSNKPDGYSESILVGYNFTNGKSRYRKYYVDTQNEQTMKLIADIFNDTNYKVSSAPVLEYGPITEYTMISVRGKYTNEKLDLTPDMQEKLLEAYEKDYMSLSFDTATTVYPVGILQMYYTKDTDNSLYSSRTYSSSGVLTIYPTYTNTIAVLEEMGSDITREISAEEVKSIDIDSWYVTRKYGNGSTSSGMTGYLSNLNITDKDQIREVLNSIENPNLEWYIGGYSSALVDDNCDIYYNVYIETYDSELNQQISDYEFRIGEVPEFVASMVGE